MLQLTIDPLVNKPAQSESEPTHGQLIYIIIAPSLQGPRGRSTVTDQ